jgi:type 1 glutamine amidotransferase
MADIRSAGSDALQHRAHIASAMNLRAGGTSATAMWISPKAALAMVIGLASFSASFAAERLYSGKPIRALLVTGGCCHNYRFQAETMTNAISQKAAVDWTVVHEGGDGTQAEIDLYRDADWAKPYDVVVHNECFADTTNINYIQRIVAAHKAGKPAVVIHCAMHTYRALPADDWREFLGVTSRKHDHQSRYPVKVVAPEHPIMSGFPTNWITPMDELYIIEKLWPSARVLASSVSEKNHQAQPVAWVNDYHGTRVFGTTYGHSDATFRDPVFIELLARGLVWSAGKLK